MLPGALVDIIGHTATCVFLCVVSGIVGSVVHFIFDVAWLLQKDPELQRFELFTTAPGGQAPPLAPSSVLGSSEVHLLHVIENPDAEADERVGAGENHEFRPEAPLTGQVVAETTAQVHIEIR